jgi:DNA (cytosine-5)-methyltransferase 1
MSAPAVLLDLFCSAGGAAKGYTDAGFQVVGVDNNPQPRYPYEFQQGDAIAYLAAHGREFDAIHASPPCQSYSKGAGRAGTRDNHARLITVTHSLLRSIGRPWVIENIEQAARELPNGVMLCGSQFGLGVFRHRIFWSSFDLTPPSDHDHGGGFIGDGRYVTVTGNSGGRSTRDGIQHGRKVDWERAMRIDWMTTAELAQAIPPAYTAYVGAQLKVMVAAPTCHAAAYPDPYIPKTSPRKAQHDQVESAPEI